MAINLPRPPNRQEETETTNRNTYWQKKKKGQEEEWTSMFPARVNVILLARTTLHKPRRKVETEKGE